MQTVFFYLGIACLFTHELDAVTHSEWRLLFFLRTMPDATAAPLFVALHVPMFFLICWLSQHDRPQIRSTTQIVTAAFLVIHAIMHLSNSAHPAYEFHDALSLTLIFGAAAFGAAHLVARWRSW